ncbi:hypothetical protein QYR09_07840 [Cellulophaga lytica]|uniref:hypothetical protein n=1 Tax=Cellulophaga omnivescoria TaxID=1888890 RepID=UPI000987B274|nr:hypothetical protein [Cellulophaga omnivescoria]WKB82940.1 hypothetical protein QYR09_07840 [Cellulophaga lytica]
MSEYLAHIKYEGKLVEDGFLDARKSAEILIGIDEVIRFFLIQENKEISKLDIEIPIRVEKGSWMAILPPDLSIGILTAIGTLAGAYGMTALHTVAKNDFKDVTSKDITKKIVKGIKWTIEIIKHLKKKKVKKFPDAKIELKEGIQMIGIPNENGELLFVPLEYLKLYTKVPEKLLDKLTKQIEEERELEIDFSEKYKGDNDDTGTPAKINYGQKSLFFEEKEEDDILFPELKHGMYVELEGHLSRGNEKTNTLGFEYEKHTLTCIPYEGNIKNEKQTLFTNCTIKGYIDRLAKDGTIKEKRPLIRYLEIENNDEEKPNLFE